MSTEAPAPPRSADTPVAELSTFLDHALPRFRAEWGTDQDDTFDAMMAWQRILAEGNWVAPAWLVEHGGRGLTPAERIACEQELWRRRAPMIAGTLGVKNVGPTIAHWGTPEQRAHLPRILDGSEVWCQGFSEPDYGSDLAGLRTSAVSDGDDVVVNGEKIWTSAGLRATHCQVLVRTDPSAPKHKGISALLVPLDLPGIERRPIRQMDGRAEFASVIFTDVRVPVTALLGPRDEGWRVTMTTLGHERSGVASFATRVEEDTLDLLDRARTAGPLDPAMRHELVRRYIDGRLLGLMGRKILTALAAGVEPGPEQSIIKLAWSVSAQRLAATDFDLAGIAATAGLEPRRTALFLRAPSMTIAAGTTEIMKNILGERVLGLPREP